jgi:transposase
VNRFHYLQRAREFQPRGADLPHAKLTEEQAADILSCVRQRDNMRQYIKQNLSNEALAQRFGVSLRCIERLTSRETWTHLRG